MTDHVGDSCARDLLREVLLQTKMSWNSARFAERLPVTVRFAGARSVRTCVISRRNTSLKRGTPCPCSPALIERMA